MNKYSGVPSWDVVKDSPCFIVGTDGVANTHSLRNKEDLYEQSVGLVLMETKQNTTFLDLITNPNDLKFGETFLLKGGPLYYDFTLRKKGEAPSNYLFPESEEQYNNFLLFLRKAFQEKRLYKKSKVFTKIKDNKQYLLY